MVNAISVDVEDYFHPSEIQKNGPMDWDALPSRVEAATDRVLELMAKSAVRGTFFVLGWVARRHPAVVRKILSGGHELGCHSLLHRLVYDLTPQEFRRDTEDAQQAIADACGVLPRLYRAPSYSITEKSLWALEILAECGFTHDSSIYPIAHDRYGIPGFERGAHRIKTPSGEITEVPIATAHLSGARVIPVGGGGYLRLLPYRYTAAGLRRVNEIEKTAACVYFHPWEMDSDQPRLAKGWIAELRTYRGLSTMEAKVARLMAEFRFAPITEVFPGSRQ